MPSESELTRSGPRRLGDKYQDLIAMDTLINWLENPEKFESICVEDDEMGALDDVVCYLPDGSVIVKQVKFTVDQNQSEFTWEYLLDQEPGKKGPKPSLLQKWSRSFLNISATRSVINAGVVTNRRPSQEFSTVLNGTRVDLALLKETSFYPKIIGQIEDEDSVRSFFASFEFGLSQPSLKGLEAGLQMRFFRLGGSDEGWFNLLHQIPIWSSKKGIIGIETVKNAALWNKLQSLPQEFEIPVDYVPPSAVFHEDLKKNILGTKSGVTVLTGNPGMGKSTYFSYLYQQLRAEGVPVVRHHYYLSANDRDFSHRLEYQAAAESLMYDIARDYPDSVACNSRNNPSPNDLRNWLEESGKFLSQRGASLIVMLDGLDHVWREQQTIQDLEMLFRQFWPVPQGISLLVATQPVDDSKLPRPLFRAAPREKWIVLPPLDEIAVAEWAKLQTEHWPKQHLDNETYLTDLAAKLTEKSGGHPLYLRYAIRYFLEQAKPFDIENVEKLPPCPHKEIHEYYSQLWASLSQESRVLLILIVSSSFPWPKEELINCLDPKPAELGQHLQSLSEINHLLSVGDLGVEPFHSSLSVFVSSLPDYEEIARRLKQTVLSWLDEKAPEYWKWGFLWNIQAELGDDTLLCDGPNRKWLVNALARRRRRRDIENILSGSFKALLAKKDLPDAVRVSILNDYAYTAHEFIGDVLELLLMPQLVIETQGDAYFQARLFSSLHDLRPSEIATLAEFVFLANRQESVQRCLRELDERLDRNTRRVDFSHQGDDLLVAVLKVIALSEQPSTRSIIDWAIGNRKTRYCALILHHYSRNLRAFHRTDQLRRFCGDCLQILAEHESNVVLRQAILMALENNIDLDDIVNSAKHKSLPLIRLYEILRGRGVKQMDNVVLPEKLLFFLSWSEQYERKDEIKDHFCDLFFGFLANCLAQNQDANIAWLATIDGSTWQGRFVYLLHDAVKAMVDSKSTWSIHLLFENISDLPRPTWRENRDEEGYADIAVDALADIVFDLVAVNANSVANRISDSDIQIMVGSKYFNIDSWLEQYLRNHRNLLDEPALDWLISNRKTYLEGLIAPLAECAKSYALMASLSSLHRLPEETSSFIMNAADSLIGYYYHKDMLFDCVLGLILSCNNAYFESGQNPAEWGGLTKLLELAPAIDGVLKFTDGDETSHLPVKLGTILCHMDARLFIAYLKWLRESREYDDELQLLQYYLTNTQTNDPLDNAIAGTAVDDTSLSDLVKRAAAPTTSDLDVLTKLRYLGTGTFQDAQQSTGSDSSNRNDDKEPPALEDFPPGSFEKFLDELDSRHIIFGEEVSVAKWVNHWKTIDKEKVYSDLVNAIEKSSRIRVAHLIYSLSTDLYGSEQSFAWLIKAQKQDLGWISYYSSKEKAVRNWQIIRDRYPEKWFEFIAETFGGGISEVSRLVEYCIFLGQKELAAAIMNEVVYQTLELVSSLRLPVPAWVSDNNGTR